MSPSIRLSCAARGVWVVRMRHASRTYHRLKISGGEIWEGDVRVVMAEMAAERYWEWARRVGRGVSGGSSEGVGRMGSCGARAWKFSGRRRKRKSFREGGRGERDLGRDGREGLGVRFVSLDAVVAGTGWVEMGLAASVLGDEVEGIEEVDGEEIAKGLGNG